MEFPKDVLTAARISVFEFETFIQEMDLHPDGNEASEELVDTIARAILAERAAERERCASIADVAAAFRISRAIRGQS